MTTNYLVNGTTDLTSLFQNNLTSTFYTPTGPVGPRTGYKISNEKDLGDVLAPLFQGVTGPVTGFNVQTGTLNYNSPYGGGDLNTLFAKPFYSVSNITGGLFYRFVYSRNYYGLIFQTNSVNYSGTAPSGTAPTDSSCSLTLNLQDSTNVNYLVVGGGGGGGGNAAIGATNYAGMGGGGGAVIYNNNQVYLTPTNNTPLSLNITVGYMGAGCQQPTGNVGYNGGSSSINIVSTGITLTAGGGGGGGRLSTGNGSGGNATISGGTFTTYGFGGSGGGGAASSTSVSTNTGGLGGTTNTASGGSGLNGGNGTTSSGAAGARSYSNNAIIIPFTNSSTINTTTTYVYCGNGGGGGTPLYGSGAGAGSNGINYGGNAGFGSGKPNPSAGISAYNGIVFGPTNGYHFGNGGGGGNSGSNIYSATGGNGSAGVVMIWWSHA